MNPTVLAAIFVAFSPARALVQQQRFATGSAAVHVAKQASRAEGHGKRKAQIAPPAEVLEVLRGNEEAAAAVNAQLEKLQASMRMAEVQMVQEAHAQKDQHNSELKAMRTEIQSIEYANLQISAEIRDLHIRELELRQEAAAITAGNKVILSDMSSFWHNMSYAQEFLVRSFNSSMDHLHAAPELNILKELREKDAKKAQELEAERWLSAFANSTDVVEDSQGMNKSSGARRHVSAAMMQVDNRRKSMPFKHASAPEMLSVLNTTLETSAAQKRKDLMSLAEKFKEEVNRTQAKKQNVLEKQASLNATLAEEEKLVSRLEAAVDFLADTRQELQDERKALRDYADQLGDEPLSDHSTRRGAGTTLVSESTSKHASLLKKMASLLF